MIWFNEDGLLYQLGEEMNRLFPTPTNPDYSKPIFTIPASKSHSDFQLKIMAYASAAGKAIAEHRDKLIIEVMKANQ